MSLWHKPLGGHRLEARFRWAALFMLLPLLGLAGISGAGLVVSTQASGALESARQLSTEVHAADEDVQGFGLKALSVLIGRATDDLSALTASDTQVGSALTTLASEPGLTADQASALPARDAAWRATLAHRDAVHQMGTASQVDPAAQSALEDSISTDVASLTSRLAALEAAGETHITGLQQQRDA